MENRRRMKNYIHFIIQKRQKKTSKSSKIIQKTQKRSGGTKKHTLILAKKTDQGKYKNLFVKVEKDMMGP